MCIVAMYKSKIVVQYAWAKRNTENHFSNSFQAVFIVPLIG